MYKICLMLISSLFPLSSLFAQLDFSTPHSFSSPLLQEMDKRATEGKYERISSILVAHKGKLIFEKYYNGNDQNSLHNTRSATKTMGTLLTGIAIDKGYIKSEQDPIFSYLQHKMPVQNPDPRKEEITLEDLLTMSSLLEASDDNYFSRGHEERMYIIEDWTQFFIDLPIRSFPFGPKPKDLPYGRSFSYASASSAAVAEILESAIKMKLDVFAKKYLFTPLGIETYKLDYTPRNMLNTAGGSEYRSRDFLKLIQLCLNKGVWEGKQVISSDWIEKATTPKVNAREGVDYGYLFWINPFGKEKKYDAYYMAGNGGNKMIAIPKLDLSVVITAKNYNNRNAHGYSDEIMNEFIVPAILEK